MTAPVLIAPDVWFKGRQVPLSSVPGAGEIIEVRGEEARHGRDVKRLRSGEPIDLVDGKGGRLSARVAIDKQNTSGLSLETVRFLVEAPPSPNITLVQALAKGGRDEQAVEASTELGVNQVVAWQADRSTVRWSGKKEASGLARWQRVVKSAVKQSRQAWVPDADIFVNTTGLVALIGTRIASGSQVLLCDEASAEPITEVLSSHRDRDARPVVVIVGPEGGVSDAERKDLKGAGAVSVLLGDTVLRSSTAGPAALVVVKVLGGSW